jgi:alpha-N-acetylglucosamine transferase
VEPNVFKYDLTGILYFDQPSCFKYVEKFSPDACIYFDPDILVFNSLDTIYDKLQQHSIIVTPHITTIQDQYTGKLNERNLLYSLECLI